MHEHVRLFFCLSLLVALILSVLEECGGGWKVAPAVRWTKVVPLGIHSFTQRIEPQQEWVPQAQHIFSVAQAWGPSVWNEPF